MLEFCVGLIKFLSKSEENSTAVPCKAGKGIIVIMICFYLIFSGIASITLNVVKNYAYRRSCFNKVRNK